MSLMSALNTLRKIICFLRFRLQVTSLILYLRKIFWKTNIYPWYVSEGKKCMLNFAYVLNELSHPYSTNIDTICTKRHLGNLFGHKDESTKFWKRFLSKSPEENRKIFCNFYLPSSHQVLFVVAFIEVESGIWLCSKD